jgi:PAS domain-containing protein
MRNWLRDTLPIFAEHNRLRALLFAALLIIVIPIVDRLTAPEIFLGFLYLFPIVIAAGFVSRVQIVLVALLCAILQEMFNSLPREEAEIRLLFSVLGFAATGLFISELALRRRRDLLHLTELRSEVKLREDAEAQLRLLIESNPAAIVTIAPSGEIVPARARRPPPAGAKHQLLLASAQQRASGIPLATASDRTARSRPAQQWRNISG